MHWDDQLIMRKDLLSVLEIPVCDWLALSLEPVARQQTVMGVHAKQVTHIEETEWKMMTLLFS